MSSTIDRAIYLFATQHKEINALLELLAQPEKPSENILGIRGKVEMVVKSLVQDTEMFLDRHLENGALSIFLSFKTTVISVTAILRSKEEVLNCLKGRIIRVTRDNSINMAIGGFFRLQKDAITVLSAACEKTISTLLQSSETALTQSPKERFSPEVRSYLVSQLDSVELPSYDLRVSVAQACGLSLEQVNSWIYNRRSRHKRRTQRSDWNNSSIEATETKPDNGKETIVIKPHDDEPYQDFQHWLSLGFFQCFTMSSSDALSLLQTMSPFKPGARDDLLSTTACLLIPKELPNALDDSSSCGSDSVELGTLLANSTSATHLDHFDSKPSH